MQRYPRDESQIMDTADVSYLFHFTVYGAVHRCDITDFGGQNKFLFSDRKDGQDFHEYTPSPDSEQGNMETEIGGNAHK